MTTRAGKLMRKIAKRSDSGKYTISDLFASAKKHRKVFNKAGKVVITEMTPRPAQKTLVIRAEAYGTARVPYRLNITFNQVRYSDTKDRTHQLQVMLGDGNYMYMGFLSKTKTPVKVRCSCPDSFFTWQWWNAGVKALVGPNKPIYKRKTTTWPERNPCFVGSTQIKLLDGSIKTMEELSHDYHNESFWIYAYHEGKVVPGKARLPRITGYIDTLIEVELDNGKKERCTVDHLWLARNGKYVEAQNLKSGDSLMPLYTKVSTESDQVKSIQVIKLDKEVPIFDFTVNHYHNFALNSGVFVHNSHSPGPCKHIIALIRRLERDHLLIK